MYAARILGVEGFGQYGYAIALAAFFTVLAESGLFLHQSRTFPQLKQNEEKARFLADGILLRFVLGAIAAILLAGVSLISGRSVEVRVLTTLFAVAIFINNITGGYSSFLYGSERFGLFGILSGGTQIITTITGFMALYLGCGLIGIGVAQVVTAILAMVIIGVLVSRKFCRPASWMFSERLFELFKKSLPLGIVGIMVIFYNRANFTLVSLMAGDKAAGFYNAAFALMNGCFIFAATIGSVFLPRLAGLYNHDDEALANLYKTAYRYLLFFGLGMAFGTLMISLPLIQILYSNKYSPSARPLMILIWAAALMFPNALGQTLLIARQTNRPLVKMVSIAAIINVTLCLFLIPHFGYMGAASAMLTGEVFLWLYGFILNREYLSLAELGGYLWKALLASLVMLVFIRLIHNASLGLIVAGGAFVYIVVLFVIKGLSLNDVNLFVKAARR